MRIVCPPNPTFHEDIGVVWPIFNRDRHILPSLQFRILSNRNMTLISLACAQSADVLRTYVVILVLVLRAFRSVVVNAKSLHPWLHEV
jgi:hypothetical protein